MWTREEVKSRGKLAMNRNYWPTVAATFILGICGGGASVGNGISSRQNSDESIEELLNNVSPEIIIATLVAIMGVVAVVSIIGILLKIFVFNPLSVACYRFFAINDREPASLNELTYGFSTNYKNIVLTMFLRDLYVSLWSLLCVIPGIVKSYEYLMVPYLLAENSEMTSDEAFAMSKEMMMGNKMDTFVLQLSFIGWLILSVLTCGILAIFYVSPYMTCTMGALYNRLKDNNTTPGGYADVYQTMA